MGNLIKFIALLVFVDLMFIMFIPFNEVTPQAVLIKGMIYSLTGETGGNLANSTSTGTWGYFSGKYFCSAEPQVPGDFSVIDSIKNLVTCNNGTLLWLVLGIMVVTFALTKGITVLGTGVQAGGTVDVGTLVWMAVGTFFLLGIGMDFITIFSYLQGTFPPFSRILALLIFIPLSIIYSFVLLEWIRGKD